MGALSEKVDISEVTQGGSNNTQQVAKTIINNYGTTPFNESKKSFIIQDIIENIIELELSFEASEVDVKIYDISKKVDHNRIEIYKEAFDFFMGHRQVIQSRLHALENNLTPLATNKLFMVIRNLYHKYVYLKDPDSIIGQMQTELSNILLASNPENYDNISYVPSIIFYVFSECQIFKKPSL